MNLLPVIMSGGSGSRLWPQSRSLYPKQFLPLVNERSMLQNTIARLDGLSDIGKPLLIANEDHRFLVAEQIRQMGREAEAIILEPVGRNTAPAVALAALKALNHKGPVSVPDNTGTSAISGGRTTTQSDALLLVLAADHVIQDEAAFHRAIEAAMPAARDGKLVTFGIVPSHPETGYGYIKALMEPQRHKDTKQDFEQETFVLCVLVVNIPSCRLSSSSRNRNVPPQKNTLPQAIISGTPACLCSRRHGIWRS